MPAENAAMERKVHPKAWTYANIAAMKKQLQSMGLSLDWSREIATCDPAYYKHQQRMFLDFLQAGLVERKQSKVNWDPVDMTVLANEQVIDGRGWRSGAVGRAARADAVVLQDQRLFAKTCSSALDKLDRWPEKVRLMQKNWIGRSRGPAGPLRARSRRPCRTARASWRSSRRGRTPCSARSSWRSRRIIRWRKAAAQNNPTLAAFIDECQHMGTAQAEIDTAEKLGFDTGIRARASVRSGLEAAGLRRELHPDGIRHRRDLRLPGARPARPRLRQQIRPRQYAGGLPAGPGPGDLRHHRHRL